MTVGGVCALHPDAAAAFVCARCGDNGCDACANRVVPTAQPICATCWAARAKRVATLKKDDGSHLGWLGLGLGVVGLIPLALAAQIAAIIVGVFALRRMPPAARWRPLGYVAIALGALGLLGSSIAVLVIAAGAI